MTREPSAATRQADEETEASLVDTAVRVADLATKKVAIAAADDPDYDYYLIKVTSYAVVELGGPMTDDYGCTFPRGSSGLKGHVFVLCVLCYKSNI